MKRIKPIVAMALGIALASCSGNKTSGETANEVENNEATSTVSIDGKWYLDAVVVNDSVSIKPAEAVTGAQQYVTFDNGSYFIRTNCNTFSGSYTQNGDSLTIDDGLATEMACDNMATEDALRQILPAIATVSAENDSIVRLNTSATAGGYILLRKASEQ